MSKDVLYYAGDGRFLIGIPTTDLTPDELEATAARLNVTAAQLRKKAVDSGIYVNPKVQRGSTVKTEQE
jgi:hypothetical protein